MRGLIRPRMLTQKHAAARAKVCLKCRARSLGRAGGKCPGEGLCESNQAQIAGEGETSPSYPRTARRVVHQPTHQVVRQHPAVELLTHPRCGLAAKRATAGNEVGFKLIKHRLDFPALVIHSGQRERGGDNRETSVPDPFDLTLAQTIKTTEPQREISTVK